MRAAAWVALRAGARRRRTETLSACALRSVGEGDARRVLRSCGTGRGARGRRGTYVRCGFRRGVLRHAVGREPEGFRLMDSLATQEGMKETRTSGEEFFARARSRLTLEVPPALTDDTIAAKRGDLDLDPSLWERAGVKATRPAAVLVGVVDRTEPMVLLTQRNAALEAHAGQIAFPGGKIEPQDASPAAAALREAWEEVGLDHGLVEPIGYLDVYLTFSGFRILPMVARVAPGYRLALNRAEVDEAFEVPLAFLMDAQNHALHSRDWKGVIRRYYAMPFGERYIWGVTAGILRNLYERAYLGDGRSL